MLLKHCEPCRDTGQVGAAAMRNDKPSHCLRLALWRSGIFDTAVLILAASRRGEQRVLFAEIRLYPHVHFGDYYPAKTASFAAAMRVCSTRGIGG